MTSKICTENEHRKSWGESRATPDFGVNFVCFSNSINHGRSAYQSQPRSRAFDSDSHPPARGRGQMPRIL